MIDLLAWVLLLVPALVTLVLAVELAAGQLQSPALPAAGTPRVAIVIPAHDEAAMIGEAVATIRAAMPDGARLLVIADNCTDATASLARDAGAEVSERTDAARRGKGFALAHARDHLAGDPPEVVVVVDADCRIDRDGLARIAAAARGSGRPIQSAYLLRARPAMGIRTAVSGLAFLIRNLVRQRGLARLGAPALLTGSGMAFPWPLFQPALLAGDDLVEDLAFGIALTRAGHPPLFLPEARTWSDPAAPGDMLAQRTRWEQGFLRTARTAALPMMAKGQWWLGLHLLVPPLALLATVDIAALLLLAGLAGCGATPLPSALLASLLMAVLILLGVSWARFGRAQIRARQLLLIPAYMLWKLPIYIAAIVRPERQWIRTKRR